MASLSGLSEQVQFQGFPWRSRPCSPAGLMMGAKWAGERCAMRFPSNLKVEGSHCSKNIGSKVKVTIVGRHRYCHQSKKEHQLANTCDLDPLD